jgi:hypothetical protein
VNAFAAMEAALHADANLSMAASYQLVTGGPAFPVRVLFSEPDGTSFGGRTSSIEASVTAASLAPYGRPQRGDVLTLEDDRSFKVEEPEMDAVGVQYTLRLSGIAR